MTSFCLSLGGVEFLLEASSIGSSIRLEKGQDDHVMLQLTNFTGALKVTQLQTTGVMTNGALPEHQQTTSRVSLSPQPQSFVSPNSDNLQSNDDMSKNRSSLAQQDQTEEGSFRASKKTRKAHISTSNKSKKAKKENNSETKQQEDKPEEAKLEPLLMKDDEDHDHDVLQGPMDEELSLTQLGMSPPPQHAPFVSAPAPRWGHTLTRIDDDRVLVYGGQNHEGETLGDIFMYSGGEWTRPIQCEGVESQWHSASYIPNRQLLVVFGGESPGKKLSATNQVMVLDTEIMLWYPPTVSGDVPSARSGHTSTVLSNNKSIVVFGGTAGNNKWHSSVHVLDTSRWKWTQQTKSITGDAPRPRSYHSATLIRKSEDKDWIVIIGGNNGTQCFQTVHVLEITSSHWTWIHPMMMGDEPVARTGHAATLLEDGKTILIHGGWDPNGDGDDDNIFDDAFTLDTSTWTWAKVGSTEGRVGHGAVCSGSKVQIFGGRLPGNTLVNDWMTIRCASEGTRN